MISKKTILPVILLTAFIGCELEEIFLPPEPVVRITAPLPRAAVLDTVTITVEASDDKGIANVRLYIDGVPAPQSLMLYEPYTYKWSTSSLPDSSVHEIYAVATDIDSNHTVSEKINVMVYSFTPAGFTAAIVADTLITLTWLDASSIETGYQVLEAINDSGFVVIKNLPANATRFDQEGAYLSTNKYSYKVRAVAGDVKSHETIEQVVWPSLNPLSPVKFDSVTDSSVAVSWTNSRFNFPLTHEVEVSFNNGPYMLMKKLPPDATSAVIDTLFHVNTPHRFRIRWLSKYNASPYSSVLTSTIRFLPGYFYSQPVAPTGVRLLWLDDNSFETGMTVERKRTVDAELVGVASLAANTTSWDDFSIDTNFTYSYRYRAFTPRNVSPYSNVVTIAYDNMYYEHASVAAHTGEIVGMTFQPNGDNIVSVGSDGTVKILNAHSATIQSQFAVPGGAVRSMALSGDGVLLAIGFVNGNVVLYNTGTQALVRTLTGHTGSVAAMDFNGTSTLLASGGADSTIRIWNLQTGQLQQTVKQHAGEITSVSFRPGENIIVSSAEDKSVKAVQLQPESVLWSKVDTLVIPLSVAFSTSGSMIAVGRKGNANPLHLYNADGTTKNEYPFFANGINHVSFSKDDSIVVTACTDGTLRTFYTATNAPGVQFNPGFGEVAYAIVNDDRRFIAGCSKNGTIKIWHYRKLWQKI